MSLLLEAPRLVLDGAAASPWKESSIARGDLAHSCRFTELGLDKSYPYSSDSEDRKHVEIMQGTRDEGEAIQSGTQFPNSKRALLEGSSYCFWAAGNMPQICRVDSPKPMMQLSH